MAVSGSADFRQPTVAPNVTDGDRDDQGRFQLGNGAAVTTGLRTQRAQLPDVFRALEEEVQAFLNGSLADDGGVEAIPTRRLSQHHYRAVLHRLARQLVV